MPFKSRAQMLYLYKNHPKVAKKFATETRDMRALPQRAKKGKKRRLMLHQKLARGIMRKNK